MNTSSFTFMEESTYEESASSDDFQEECIEEGSSIAIPTFQYQDEAVKVEKIHPTFLINNHEIINPAIQPESPEKVIITTIDGKVYHNNALQVGNLSYNIIGSVPSLKLENCLNHDIKSQSVMTKERKHLDTQKGKVKFVTAFECSLCKKIYYDEKSLIRHAQSQNCKNAVYTTIIVPVRPEKLDYTEIVEVDVSQSDANVKSLASTSKLKKNVRSSNAKLKISLKDSSGNGEKEFNKIFECFQCRKGFSHKRSLVRHAKKKICAVENIKSIEGDGTEQKSRDTSTVDQSRIGMHLTHSGDSNKVIVSTSCEAPIESELSEYNLFPSKTEMDKLKRMIRFRCNECLQSFKEEPALLNHIKLHDNERKFGCVECGFRFSRSSHLKRHLLSKHNLDVADEPWRKGEVLEEKKKSFKCRDCDKCYATKPNFVKHMKKHSNRKFRCEKCGFRFTRSDHLKRHIRLIHANGKTTKKRTVVEKKKFKCNYCTKTYSEEVKLKRHAETHNLGRKYECLACNFNFQRIADFGVHLKTQHGEFLYVCYECDTGFALKSLLLKHVKEKHEQKQNGTLPPKRDFLSSWLKITNGDNFECNYCMQAFIKKETLAKHMELHFSDRKYGCHACDRKYPRLDQLQRHVRRLHGSTLEDFTKTTSVSHGKAMYGQEEGASHANDGAGLSEDKSKKGEKTKEELVLKNQAQKTQGRGETSGKTPNRRSRSKLDDKNGDEKRVRRSLKKKNCSDERPHVCPQCKRAFKLKSNLTKHLQSHSGLRPYFCVKCDFRFIYKQNLTRHLQDNCCKNKLNE